MSKWSEATKIVGYLDDNRHSPIVEALSILRYIPPSKTCPDCVHPCKKFCDRESDEMIECGRFKQAAIDAAEGGEKVND